MKEICEQMVICARKSKYIDQQSGVSARLSIANYKIMIASSRQRAIRLGEKPAVPRMSDLAHFHSSAVGKLVLAENDLDGFGKDGIEHLLLAHLMGAHHVEFEFADGT